MTQSPIHTTATCLLSLRAEGCRAAWVVDGGGVGGGDIGGFGGGSLEHPRQWPGAQQVGLHPWERRAARSRQVRPEEAQDPISGTAKKAL